MARQFEEEQQIFGKYHETMDILKNKKEILSLTSRRILSKQEKKKSVERIFKNLITREEQTYHDFKNQFLKKTSAELKPLEIRSLWNTSKESHDRVLVSWDKLTLMIHYEIMMEQRDNNSEKSIQGWKQLLGSVEKKKNFWKGDFWPQYWEIQVDLKKARELEQKDQSDFEAMMKELDFSDLPSMEVLEDSFNQAIDSAEHLAHLWKDIVHRHQLALRNDSCLKEFSDEIVEAKNSLDYWNIEGLSRRALGHEKVALLLSCKATHRDPLEEKFHLNWMKARDAIYDTQASYRSVKGVISKIINELSAHVSHQDNDQMLHDWLEEVEYEIVFWESEISWSEGEEAHLIAAYATENCYFHEDWSSNSSDDDSDVMHEEPDYLSQSRLYNIKKAIYLLSRARDVQSNAISKLPPKFHENFQDKYNLASDKINHWNRFLYDATTSKDY